jgi:hypothetical protein
MCGREVHSFACQPRCRLDQARPLESAVLTPEQLEPGGQSGDPAGCRADRVVNELGAERHFEMQQFDVMLLGAQAGHRNEAIQVARTGGLPVEKDGMTTAEQPCHHGFGDA